MTDQLKILAGNLLKSALRLPSRSCIDIEIDPATYTVFLDGNPHLIVNDPNGSHGIPNGSKEVENLIPNPFFQCVIPRRRNVQDYVFCFSDNKKRNPEMLRVLENLRRGGESSIVVVNIQECSLEMLQKMFSTAKLAIVDPLCGSLFHLFAHANCVPSLHIQENMNHATIKFEIRKLISSTDQIFTALRKQQKISRLYFDKLGDPKLVGTVWTAIIIEITTDLEYLLRSILFASQLYCRADLMPILRRILHSLDLDDYYHSILPFDIGGVPQAPGGSGAPCGYGYLELSLLL
jgi:hypothetical protein